MNDAQKTTLEELFPAAPRFRWLNAADLKGQSIQVTIAGFTREMVYDVIDKQKVLKAAIKFLWKSPSTGEVHPMKKQLLLNITQAEAIESITGSLVVDDWTGTALVLTPGIQKGKQTIIITAAQNTEPALDPPDTEAGDDANHGTETT